MEIVCGMNHSKGNGLNLTDKKVNGELTVKTAEALHYVPGTRKVAAEVEYRLP